jgi:23S rRNA U2552 (ribose-2'-O)-methylase RlmE/FtsJ
MSGSEDEWQTVGRSRTRQQRQRICYIEDEPYEAHGSYDAKNDTLAPCVENGMEIQGNGGPALCRWEHPWNEVQYTIMTPEGRALQHVKNDIQKEAQWDDFKKITNPYEYVFLSWNRRSSRSVATRQPLSRSYFKMVEIWRRMDLGKELASLVQRDGGLKTAHAAEGPGGFIEACWEQSKILEWPVLQTDAITLRSDARNIPGWRKASRFLAERPQIHIHEGADGTGDILLRMNQDAFIDVAAGAHIYTADGGFDFSADYNAQEDNIFPLLLAECILGIQSLCIGGCMVIKCFDTIEPATLDLLWIVSRCFREWVIMKPRTSRAGNAERYFVGKGRLPYCEDSIAFLQKVQEKKNWVAMPGRLIDVETKEWREWRDALLAFQERVEHQEYEIIRKTLDLIHAHDFARIRSLVRENIRRSLEWCREFGEPYSLSWANDMERNVTRETQDLLQIISPASGFQTTSWYSRTAVPSTITFQGFRTMEADTS